MYDHRALPLNAVSPLDPRNKPLPKKPPPASMLSPFPPPPPSSMHRQMVVSRSMPGSTTGSMVIKPAPQRQQQPLIRKPCQQKHNNGDLFTAFPLPRKAPRPPYANASTASSICGDSISSSTLSLPFTIEPLRLRRGATTPVGAEEEPRPRPDSLVLSSDAPFLRPSQQLDGRYFWALSRDGDTMHYWLPVDLVLRGLPGSAYVPRGHWDRLVKLAEDVRLSSGCEVEGTAGAGKVVQLVKGRCNINEPLGELDVFGCEGGVPSSAV